MLALVFASCNGADKDYYGEWLYDVADPDFYDMKVTITKNKITITPMNLDTGVSYGAAVIEKLKWEKITNVVTGNHMPGIDYHTETNPTGYKITGALTANGSELTFHKADGSGVVRRGERGHDRALFVNEN